jgi:DNA-binding response OmpR family regulator
MAALNPSKPLNKPLVLVVDDEPELAELLATKLQTPGYRTQTCGRVTDAITKLNNQKFDCILLDLRLERGSGERGVDILRSDSNLPNHLTPILVMSGNLDAQVIGRLGNKISGVLVKPLDTQALLAKIQGLTGSPASDAPKAPVKSG